MKKQSNNSVSSQGEAISVLTTLNPNLHTVKRFRLDDAGELVCDPYGKESYFSYSSSTFTSIDELGLLVSNLSKSRNAVIIAYSH